MKGLRGRVGGLDSRRSRSECGNRCCGFTLIELLVTLSILAVVIAVIASCLSGGLRVWDLARTFNRQDSEIAIGLSLMERDIANAVPFSGGGFAGSERAVRFSCLARARSSGHTPREGDSAGGLAIWTTRYYVDPQSRTIARERSLAESQAGQGPDSLREAVLTGVENATFSYQSLAGASSATWDSKTSMPSRVGLQLVLADGNDRRQLSCWMDLPAAFEESASGGVTNVPRTQR
jgi:prepilin-type N-terminal cleavage/methylation domain-containing protein